MTNCTYCGERMGRQGLAIWCMNAKCLGPRRCHFCKTDVEGEHDCDEKRWSSKMTRHEMIDFTTPGSAAYFCVDPCEHGDWVKWEEVVRFLKALPTHDPKTVEAILTLLASRQGEGCSGGKLVVSDDRHDKWRCERCWILDEEIEAIREKFLPKAESGDTDG